MKANELRIGNFINHIDFERLGIPHKEVFHLNNAVNEAIINYCSSELYQPIPLTEEWLYKFGFQNIDKGDNDYITYTDPNHDYYLQIDVRRKNGKYSILDNSLYFDDLRNFSMVDIMYVHQLQNLYFALTEEELTYKSE